MCVLILIMAALGENMAIDDQQEGTQVDITDSLFVTIKMSTRYPNRLDVSICLYIYICVCVCVLYVCMYVCMAVYEYVCFVYV